MPLITLTTNIMDEKIPKDLNQTLTDFFVQLLNKPAVGFSILVESGCRFTIGGTLDPAVMIEIKSIESFNEKANPGFSKKISEFIQQNLGVENDRCVIHFHNLHSYEIGRFGTTIKEYIPGWPHNRDAIDNFTK